MAITGAQFVDDLDFSDFVGAGLTAAIHVNEPYAASNGFEGMRSKGHTSPGARATMVVHHNKSAFTASVGAPKV